MKINVYAGTIKTLGASTNYGTGSSYSYIEMSNGQLIKSLLITAALNAELHSAFDKGESVELHVVNGGELPKNTYAVIAFRAGNGRLFAVEKLITGGLPPIVNILIGILLLPLLGLGLLFIWTGWSRLSFERNSRNYLDPLNPTYITT